MLKIMNKSNYLEINSKVYGMWWFIMMFAGVCHWTLLWATWNQSAHIHPITLKFKSCQIQNLH